MIRYRALFAGVLLLPQAAVALGDDWYFHYAPAVADSGPFNNPFGDTLPTLDGSVVIWNGQFEMNMPAAPGFIANDLATAPASGMPPSGFYYQSVADYEAAYSALLRVIAQDVAKEKPSQLPPPGPPVGGFTAATPEPSSVILLGLGAAGLYLAARRRRPG